MEGIDPNSGTKLMENPSCDSQLLQIFGTLPCHPSTTLSVLFLIIQIMDNPKRFWMIYAQNILAQIWCFFTMKSVVQDVFESSRSDWKSLATNYQFQGVQTSFHHSLDHAFSCDQVNIACDICCQASAFLVPWCCKSLFRYILSDTSGNRVCIGLRIYNGSCQTWKLYPMGHWYGYWL